MLSTGVGLPSALMYGSLTDQDINCRAIGRCVYGEEIDRELLDMIPRSGPNVGPYAARASRPIKPLTQNDGHQFLYARYNVELTGANLRRMGFEQVDPADVKKMDNATPDNIERLLAIGAASATQVQREHFGPFL